MRGEDERKGMDVSSYAANSIIRYGIAPQTLYGVYDGNQTDLQKNTI